MYMMFDLFVVFLQVCTIIIGIYILSRGTLDWKLFTTIVILGQIIGYFLYNIVGMWGIFLAPILLALYVCLRKRKLFTGVINIFFVLTLSIIGSYIMRLMSEYLLFESIESLKLKSHLLIINLISTLMIVILSLVVRYIFNKLQIDRIIILMKGYRILVLSFTAITLMKLYVRAFSGIEIEIANISIRLKDILFLSYIFLLCLFFAIIIRIAKREFQVEIDKLQTQHLREYTMQLEQESNELNSFRHDYINMLLTLEGAIDAEDIKSIRSIYESVIRPTKDIVRNDQSSLTALQNIQVNEARSIMVAKILRAQQKQVHVELEIEDVIGDIYMNLLDFCRVISILLDNAIEASVKSEDPYIFIAFIQLDGYQRVIVENRCSDKSINLTKIYDKGYSSKGEKRGIGLYNARLLLDKSMYATLETSYESNLFTQMLILKKRGK